MRFRGATTAALRLLSWPPERGLVIEIAAALARFADWMPLYA